MIGRTANRRQRDQSIKADVEAEVEAVCVDLDAQKSQAAELKTRATELEKQLEQSASQVHVSESKFVSV